MELDTLKTDGATETPPDDSTGKVKILDQELTEEEAKEALEALKNSKQWAKANTERAQQLAELEKQIQAREYTVQQQMYQLQQAQAQQQQVQSQQQQLQADMAELDKSLKALEEADPTLGPKQAALIKAQHQQMLAIRRDMESRYNAWYQENAQLKNYIQTIAKVQSESLKKQTLNDLKAKYPYMDEEVVEAAWNNGKYGDKLEETAKRSHNRVEERYNDYVKQKKSQGSRSVAGVKGGSPTMQPKKPIKSIKDATAAYKEYLANLRKQ